jgi:hypothetical protein
MHLRDHTVNILYIFSFDWLNIASSNPKSSESPIDAFFSSHFGKGELVFWFISIIAYSMKFLAMLTVFFSNL